MANEGISDEKLKPHFQGEDNGQEKRYGVWRIWYSSHATSNLQQETHVLTQPLALATSGCKRLPCLCLPLFSRTVYLGNFYFVEVASSMSIIIEPVSNTRQKSAKNKVRGTILLKSNCAIFDTCDIANVKANDGVIFIRTLEFNVICTTIAFR